MKKLFALGMVLSVLSLTGVAGASGHQFPAQNEPACTDAGGVFTQSGGFKTCTVTDTVITPFSGPTAHGQGWTSSGTTTTTTETVYTKTPSDVNEIDGPNVVSTSTVVTACLNPGSQSQDPSHQHCQP